MIAGAEVVGEAVGAAVVVAGAEVVGEAVIVGATVVIAGAAAVFGKILFVHVMLCLNNFPSRVHKLEFYNILC